MNITRVTKTPYNEHQLHVMSENLSHIKGLSKEKKLKLMEKNIEIKERIREKDKAIDVEL